MIVFFLILVVAVAYIAKVRILKQITTSNLSAIYRICCCLYRKGKNFKANHNKSPAIHQLLTLLLISQR